MALEDTSKWIPSPNKDGIVREVKEKRVVSREETEEIKEVEDIQHYGDITDEVSNFYANFMCIQLIYLLRGEKIY